MFQGELKSDTDGTPPENFREPEKKKKKRKETFRQRRF